MSKSPFRYTSVVTRVAIEPAKLDSAVEAIKEKLNITLFKYNDDIEGIPMSYENIKFMPGQNIAKIFGESPWLHIVFHADIVVFQPIVGQRLFGRVSKASGTHISLLIYGMFNATISADNMGQNFRFDKTHTRWCVSSSSSCTTHVIVFHFDREKNGTTIQEGSLVEFSVMSCHHSQGVYFLHGCDVR